MEPSGRQIRILWGSPLPPIRSGVSDYAWELLPELAKRAEVRVLRPPGWDPPEGWPGEIEIVPSDTQPATDEIALIHLGNNPHHLWLLDRELDRRVVIVLHDAVLHHLLVEATEARGRNDEYAERLASAHGGAGNALAAARRVGVHGRLDAFLFPARSPFLRGVAAVVVHSRWAASLLASELPELPVEEIGLSVADPGPIDRGLEREGLGLETDDVVLMHIGFLTPEKGLAEVLGGVAAAVRIGVPARLVVVGEGEGMDALEASAKAAGIDDRVVITGWVGHDRFGKLPAAADLGVVLRTPSAGETSAAALRFLACGTPVAIGASRQFLEWPELAAPRLTPGPSCPADLTRLLASVGGEGWGSRRRTARQVYEASHRPEDAARQLVDFLRGVVTTTT